MNNHNPLLRLQCCNNCQRSSCEFKQAVNLKKSGLAIYIHVDELKQKRIRDGDGKSIILYNTGDKELKRFDYIVELCRYKTKCFRCTAIIQRIRNLLEDITSIRKNQVVGVCEYCKRSNMRNKCKRCEYSVNKFIEKKVQECKDHEESFMTWLLKVQRLLTSMMHGHVFCKHNQMLDIESKTQLDNLLQHIKSTLIIKQPNIEIFPDSLCCQTSENNIVRSKQVLDEFLMKLKSDSVIGNNIEQILNDSESESESTCICKYLKKDTYKTSSPLFETLPGKDSVREIITKCYGEDKKKHYEDKLPSLPLAKYNVKQREKNKVAIKQNKCITEDQTDTAKRKENKDEVVKNYMSDQINKKQKSSAHGSALTSAYNNETLEKEKVKYQDLIIQLTPKTRKGRNIEKNIKIPMIPMVDLPNIKTKIKAPVDREDSGSTIKCSNTRDDKVTKMIKGNKIVRYDKHYKDHTQMKTQAFKILADCTSPITDRDPSLLEENTKSTDVERMGGFIMYKLSDHKFIENGWTQLPTTKITRKMNIYKMITRTDEYDWFKNHIEQKILFYDSGGKLAEVFENGCGKWFYENGETALEYYNSTEVTSGKRYILFSSSEDNNIINKKKTNTILGCFDTLGNGVVYDHFGNARLKYNQSEGLVIDKSIGPPSRWKWHGLNEPPVLESIFQDTMIEADPRLKDLVHETDVSKEPDNEMIAIECENFIKKRATKLLQKYKPFEIRMKAVKLNDNLSLRIINQSKIYILFRFGRNHFKQNIGMTLKCDEIIDSEDIDLGDVSTPYDRQHPKSESLADIQMVLLEAKQLKH